LKSTCRQAIVLVFRAKFQPEIQANADCNQWSMPSRQAVIDAPMRECLGRIQNSICMNVLERIVTRED
jgi:hypothetical protein